MAGKINIEDVALEMPVLCYREMDRQMVLASRAFNRVTDDEINENDDSVYAVLQSYFESLALPGDADALNELERLALWTLTEIAKARAVK